jgi:hypothetical protein
LDADISPPGLYPAAYLGGGRQGARSRKVFGAPDDRQRLRRARRCAAEEKMNDTDARLWHPWLRINRVLRVMLHTRWSAEVWSQVRVELRRAVALRSEIRRAGWFD